MYKEKNSLSLIFFTKTLIVALLGFNNHLWIISRSINADNYISGLNKDD